MKETSYLYNSYKSIYFQFFYKVSIKFNERLQYKKIDYNLYTLCIKQSINMDILLIICILFCGIVLLTINYILNRIQKTVIDNKLLEEKITTLKDEVANQLKLFEERFDTMYDEVNKLIDTIKKDDYIKIQLNVQEANKKISDLEKLSKNEDSKKQKEEATEIEQYRLNKISAFEAYMTREMEDIQEHSRYLTSEVMKLMKTVFV